jgi:HD superfamily phosphohydrolase
MCWKIIATPAFQRLRRIKQLGFSDFVYPSACHSPFAHSLGVFHTAREISQVIAEEKGESSNNHRTRVAIAAELVHDLGHGPFSHAFEDVLKRLGMKMRADGSTFARRAASCANLHLPSWRIWT